MNSDSTRFVKQAGLAGSVFKAGIKYAPQTFRAIFPKGQHVGNIFNALNIGASGYSYAKGETSLGGAAAMVGSGALINKFSPKIFGRSVAQHGVTQAGKALPNLYEKGLLNMRNNWGRGTADLALAVGGSIGLMSAADKYLPIHRRKPKAPAVIPQASSIQDAQIPQYHPRGMRTTQTQLM